MVGCVQFYSIYQSNLENKIVSSFSSVLDRLYVCMAIKLSSVVFLAFKEAIPEDNFCPVLQSGRHKLKKYDDLKKVNGHLFARSAET